MPQGHLRLFHPASVLLPLCCFGESQPPFVRQARQSSACEREWHLRGCTHFRRSPAPLATWASSRSLRASPTAFVLFTAPDGSLAISCSHQATLNCGPAQVRMVFGQVRGLRARIQRPIITRHPPPCRQQARARAPAAAAAARHSPLPAASGAGWGSTQPEGALLVQLLPLPSPPPVRCLCAAWGGVAPLFPEAPQPGPRGAGGSRAGAGPVRVGRLHSL